MASVILLMASCCSSNDRNSCGFKIQQQIEAAVNDNLIAFGGTTPAPGVLVGTGIPGTGFFCQRFRLR